MGKIKAKERSVDEKVSIVLAMLNGTSTAELVRQYRVTEVTLNKWRARFIEGGRASLASGRRSRQETEVEVENRQLKEALAEAVIRNEVLKKIFRA
jgi:transposase